MTEGPRLRWILRLVLPALMVVLVLALYDIWSDHRQGVRWADIVGSFGLLVCLFGVALWCFTAWTARPTR